MAHSFLATPSATASCLQAWGLHTKKALGQHFLVDDNVVGRILQLAQVQPGDNVLEVGPGIGTLTVALLQCGANVVSVERDDSLVPVLQANVRESVLRMQDEGTRADGAAGVGAFALLNRDAVGLDASELAQACMQWWAGEAEAGGDSAVDDDAVQDAGVQRALPTKFVANLPYAVAATLVLDYLQNLPTIDTVCVMVQTEVAQRMSALPGSKDYGAYSVKIGLLAQPTGSFAVARGSFLPPPHVESTVIRLERRNDVADPQLVAAACLAADAAFFTRRKTIRNSMRTFFGQREEGAAFADQLLQRAGIDPSSRGEAHGLEQFLALGQAYRELCS